MSRDDAMYGTTDKLLARLRLHTRFATHPQGWFPWLVSLIAPGRFARVLDVGCGEGSLWEHPVAAPPALVLADTSAAMLQRAGERTATRGLGALRLLASVERLPFRDGSFDAAIANHMLYHAADPRAAVAELARVLAPGGRLFASTVGLGSMAEIHALQRQLRPEREGARFNEIFGLHNGPDIVASAFADVEVIRYDNHLHVTDAQAVVDYLMSMEACSDLDADEQARVRQQVTREIDAVGHFHVTGESGLLVARAG